MSSRLPAAPGEVLPASDRGTADRRASDERASLSAARSVVPSRHQPRRWDRPPPVGRGFCASPTPAIALWSLAGHDLDPDLPRRRPAHPRRQPRNCGRGLSSIQDASRSRSNTGRTSNSGKARPTILGPRSLPDFEPDRRTYRASAWALPSLLLYHGSGREDGGRDRFRELDVEVLP